MWTGGGIVKDVLYTMVAFEKEKGDKWIYCSKKK